MTTFFFSGVEGKVHQTNVRAGGGRSVLASYFYIRKSPDFLDELRNTFKGDKLRILVDSGAHSVHADTFEASSVKELDEYVEQYTDWIWENREKAEAFVEFDVFIGNRLEYWREEFFRPLELAGVPIIYVWHPSAGETDQAWVNHCKRYAYVGVSKDVANPEQRIVTARRYLNKTHGFALSAYSEFSKLPFHTVDSTSWKGGELYGDAYVWWAGEMIRFKEFGEARRRARERYKSYYLEHGLDYEGILEDKTKAVTVANVKAFCLMEQEVTARRKKLEFGHLRLPPPEIIRGSNSRFVRTLKLPTIDPEGEPVDDTTRKIHATAYSAIQWGLWSDLKEQCADPIVVDELRDSFGLEPNFEDQIELERVRLLLNGKLLAREFGGIQSRDIRTDVPDRVVLPRENPLEIEPDEYEFFESE